MIEEKKKYTGEEVKKMFLEAQQKAVAKELEDLKKAGEKSDREVDPMMTFVISMQSMSAYANLFHILFKDKKEEE